MNKPIRYSPIIVNPEKGEQYANMEQLPDGDYVENDDYNKLLVEYMNFKREVAIYCDDMQQKLSLVVRKL